MINGSLLLGYDRAAMKMAVQGEKRDVKCDWPRAQGFGLKERTPHRFPKGTLQALGPRLWAGLTAGHAVFIISA